MINLANIETQYFTVYFIRTYSCNMNITQLTKISTTSVLNFWIQNFCRVETGRCKGKEVWFYTSFYQPQLDEFRIQFNILFINLRAISSAVPAAFTKVYQQQPPKAVLFFCFVEHSKTIAINNRETIENWGYSIQRTQDWIRTALPVLLPIFVYLRFQNRL